MANTPGERSAPGSATSSDTPSRSDSCPDSQCYRSGRWSPHDPPGLPQGLVEAMTGCQTCGGFGMHHDPIAHGTENDEPCMCGTPFTCMADEHDFEVARMSTVDGYAEYRRDAP
jgi:hypothetical protein